MLIKIDSREPKSMEMCMQLVDSKIIMERRFMTEGDYVCDEICIERKEISDFCNSIVDGRLNTQMEKMKQNYKNIYIIVVGRIKDRTSDIHENCILGKMTSIVVKHKIPILFADDDFQFCYLVKSLIEKLKGGSENGKENK